MIKYDPLWQTLKAKNISQYQLIKADGFDYFLYWILVGCPYGIRKMCLFLVPKNFGIAGSMGILALNCIVGGLIGGIIVVVVRIIVLVFFA